MEKKDHNLIVDSKIQNINANNRKSNENGTMDLPRTPIPFPEQKSNKFYVKLKLVNKQQVFLNL
jgi:hypothetical protein